MRQFYSSSYATFLSSMLSAIYHADSSNPELAGVSGKMCLEGVAAPLVYPRIRARVRTGPVMIGFSIILQT